MKSRFITIFIAFIGIVDASLAQTKKTISNRALDQDLCININDAGVKKDILCADGTNGRVIIGDADIPPADAVHFKGENPRFRFQSTGATAHEWGICLGCVTGAFDIQDLTGAGTPGRLLIHSGGRIELPNLDRQSVAFTPAGAKQKGLDLYNGLADGAGDFGHFGITFRTNNTNNHAGIYAIKNNAAETELAFVTTTSNSPGEALRIEDNGYIKVPSGGNARVGLNVDPTSNRVLKVQTHVAGNAGYIGFYNNSGQETITWAHDAGNQPKLEFTSENGTFVGRIEATNASLDFVSAGAVLARLNQTTGAFDARLLTVNATADVCTTASGTGLRELSACSSSRRYKEHIRDITPEERDSIYSLRGVNFDWKSENGGKNDFGLIAEEVNEHYPQMVPKNESGQPESVNYRHMVGLLVEVVKDQRRQIEKLRNRLDAAGL